MTLDTCVYLHDRIDYREVFVRCNQLIGADEGTRFTDKDGSISNSPGQGLCAWLYVYHKGEAPLLRAGEHSRYCEPDEPGEDDMPHSTCFPHWLSVSFDTAYGYKGPDGGCGDLHARLVAELGQWLDGKGVAWSWLNEFTGTVHQGYDGLTELAGDGARASEWYRDIAAPAIARAIANEELPLR